MKRVAAILFLAAVPFLSAAAPDPAPGTVKLPLAEYRKLKDAADERTRHPRPEPVSPALESARLTVTPGEESAELSSRLELNVPSAGSWKLPIPAAGKLASWESVPAGAAIVTENNGRFLVAGRPGRYVITSTEALSLSPLDGYSRCSLAAPAASSIALTVRLRSADEDLRVSAGALSREAGNVFTGTIPAGQTVALDFRAREVQAEAVRLTATRIDLVTLSGEKPEREGLAEISILSGRLAKVVLVLPPAETVESVSGDAVAGFARDSERPERVLVTLVPPAKGKVRLYWKTSMSAAGSIVPSSIDGEEGGEAYLAVVAERGREIQVTSATGLDRADPKDLSPLLRAILPDQAAILFRATPGKGERVLVASAKAFAEAAGREAVIERATVTSVLTRDGARLDRYLCDVRTKSPSLAWPLPDGATIWSVFVNGKPVKPSGEGAETRIPLRGSQGTAQVDVVISRPGVPFEKRGEATLSLFALPEPILSLSWNLFLPDGKRYRLRDGNLWQAAMNSESENENFDSLTVPAAAPPVPPLPAPSPKAAPNSGVTGNIFGHIEDEQGGRLPGVAATLSGCGKPLTTTSDSSGDFYFLNLQPCRYTVKAELSGFATIERTRIDVSAGADAHVRIVMRIASVATTITVTSESPVLDTRKQTSGTTFTQEELSGSARGVEGGVPGGVVGGVIGGSPSGSKKSRDREEKERVRASSAALVAQQVQQGLKSLPIDIPSEGKLFVVEGRLFFGEEPSVRVQYKQ